MQAFWTNSRALGRIGWIGALVIAVVFTGWGSSVAHAAASEEALLTVDGAQNLRQQPRSATSRQIRYTMDLTYPARAIGEPQWEQLKKAGWTRCRSMDPDQQAANSDWVDFEDATVTPERTIHQHLSHWFKDNQMIMISLRYYSATQSRSGR